jgi:predicted amidophosphoribosyltransferase
MNTVGIGVSLLAVVLAFGLFYKMRRLKLQVAGYASQRMCPACGLITPRSKAACLECGKPFLSAPIAPKDRR